MKLHDFDHLFIQHRPPEEICEFLKEHWNDLESHLKFSIYQERLFAPEFLLRCDEDLVQNIYNHLWFNFGYFSSLKYAGQIVQDTSVPDSTRTKFWYMIHAYKSCCYGVPDQRVSSPVFIDNPAALQSFCKYSENSAAKIFFQGMARCKIANGYKLSARLVKTLQEDSISMFEMTRLMENKDLTLSLFLCMIKYDAQQIFCHFLKDSLTINGIFPDRIILFFLCAHAEAGFAGKAIHTLEKIKPGIVREATDPFGNTPLWYTLYQEEIPTQLVKTLIQYGDDPTKRNHLNLSYELVMAANSSQYEKRRRRTVMKAIWKKQQGL